MTVHLFEPVGFLHARFSSRARLRGGVARSLLATLLALGACDPETQGGTTSKPRAAHVATHATAAEDVSYVSHDPSDGAFTLAAGGQVAPLFVDPADHAGVRRVAGHLRDDLQRVTGVAPQLATTVPTASAVVLIGTIGQSPTIDGLVDGGKLDVTGVTGVWEASVIQVVESPLPGIDRALVIAGADKRGTIYGIFDLSEKIGVSPWYYWADVPTLQSDSLYVAAGRHDLGAPVVKYRGIFINDENPSLLNWYNANFTPPNGRFRSQFYQRVYELILRLKGNYLWGAQWGKTLHDDDPESPRLADEYGVVIGTSHHEPMVRTQDEWSRYGNGAWDYNTNANNLRNFWRTGAQRAGQFENMVTVGMRGDGDKAGNTSFAQLQQIIADQRNLLQQETGRDPTSFPTIWALYKEVQNFYDQGLEVDDDITLLFADDNWGNIRRLPRVDDEPRRGGYGVYYHFDYVGGPRSYKWLNTNPIPRVWEQMNLAHQLGARQLWLVNVGDLKPMEFPIAFFLDMAWDPESVSPLGLDDYTERWAARAFGPEHAAEIAEIVAAYTKFNGRRKPELLAPETYSVTAFREAERVADEYNAIAERAQAIYDTLPANTQPAYFQLVLYPVKACANLNDLYVTVARNRLYAQQGRASANALADRAQQLYANDSTLTNQYHGLLGGKWNHMMDQIHIGWSSWNEPAQASMPSVQRIQANGPASLGVAVEGSTSTWPGAAETAVLPDFSPFQALPDRFVDVFNRGGGSFDYTIETGVPWLTATPNAGTVTAEERVWFTVDWDAAPVGRTEVPVTVTGGDASVTVQVVVDHPEGLDPETLVGYVEANGFVSVEAEYATAKIDSSSLKWQRVPDLGRTVGAMTILPVTAPAVETPGGDSPHLEYQMELFTTGDVTVRAYLSPTLDFHNDNLRYAVSFDDAAPVVVDIHGEWTDPIWEGWVANNINVTTSTHTIAEPGQHVLKFWAVDPGIVVQKLVVETGEVPSTYLGAPGSPAHGIDLDEPEPGDTDGTAGDEDGGSGAEAGGDDGSGAGTSAGEGSASEGGSGGGTPPLDDPNATEGCACQAPTGRGSRAGWAALALLGLAVGRRRRRG